LEIAKRGVVRWSGTGGGAGNHVEGRVLFRTESVDIYDNLGPEVLLEVDGSKPLLQVCSWGDDLRAKMWAQDPQPGDWIAIVYHGSRHSKAARLYGTFTVLVRKRRSRPQHSRAEGRSSSTAGRSVIG
jgi:hypothetical protein